jgi:hypothetical protein
MTDITFSDDKYTAWIVGDINKCMTGDVLKAYQTEKVNHDLKSLKFADILGPTDKPYWWRLYIDPKDWEAAEQTKEPGMLYDSQKSVGWNKAMVNVYATYLANDSLIKLLDTPLSWDEYAAIWKIAKDKVSNSEGRKSNNPDDKRNGVYYDRYTATDISTVFDSPKTLASDTLSEKIIHGSVVVNKPLVKEIDTSAVAHSHGSYVVHRVGHIQYELFDLGKPVSDGIEAVFVMFAEDMKKATTWRRDQLKAIARAIRNLHIMHAFSDGCGRINVQTLLPAMLLKYGFGLPFGGAHGSIINKSAQYMLFNGGFSLEEITQYLWVTQDFGMMSLKHGIQTILKTPTGPHTGTPNTTNTNQPALHDNTHPTTNSNHPTTTTNHPTTNTNHPTTNTNHPTTNTNHPTTTTNHPTTNINHPAANTNHPAANTNHPTTNTNHPTTNTNHPTTNTNHPTTNTNQPTNTTAAHPTGSGSSRPANLSHLNSPNHSILH